MSFMRANFPSFVKGGSGRILSFIVFSIIVITRSRTLARRRGDLTPPVITSRSAAWSPRLPCHHERPLPRGDPTRRVVARHRRCRGNLPAPSFPSFGKGGSGRIYCVIACLYELLPDGCMPAQSLRALFACSRNSSRRLGHTLILKPLFLTISIWLP